MAKFPSLLVSVELPGGLGNQLFAFATGLALSKSQQGSLELDTRAIDYSHAGMALDIRDLLSVEEFRFYKSRDLPLYLRRIRDSALHRLPFLQKRYKEYFGIVSDQDIKAGEGVSSLLKPFRENKKLTRVHLKGYFQDFTLVLEVKDLLIKFIKEDFSEPGKILRDSLDSRNVLGVHIRGGDFLNSNWRSLVGNLSSQYYLNAISKLNQNGYYFDEVWIFTNDLPYAKELIRGLDFNFKFVDNEMVERPAESFNLLKRCTGIIASNSSFSYMASYLSPKAHVVVVPESFSKAGNQIGGIPKSWLQERPIWR